MFAWLSRRCGLPDEQFWNGDALYYGLSERRYQQRAVHNYYDAIKQGSDRPMINELGLEVSEYIGVLLVEESPGKTKRVLFDEVTTFAEPPSAKSGGVVEAGILLKVPDGRSFFAVQIHGDLKGWQHDIAVGAGASGICVAKLENGRVFVSDGQVFSIDQCTISAD
jgi:hypothetical protein